MAACPYGNPLCPCQDGDACHYEWSGKGKNRRAPIAHPRHKYRRPIGECPYCDAHRDDNMMPSHTASQGCERGKRNHCTCDTCF